MPAPPPPQLPGRRRAPALPLLLVAVASLAVGAAAFPFSGRRDDDASAATAAAGLEARLFPPQGWTVGDKEYVGLLAGRDVETKLCDPDVDSQSGYFKISGSKNLNYFYWFFPSRTDPANDPFILWLTGGPGCSSILALLTENGPCSVNEFGNGTVPNPYSWTNRANVLWIDQPAGVGFSYADQNDELVDTEDEVGEDLYRFLQSFFQANPEYASNDFYVFGESYGGHYVPAAAHRIHKANLEGKNAKATRINLKGVGIGNGFTDPEIQYQYFADYARNNSYRPLVSEKAAQDMDKALPRCISLIKSCQAPSASACTLAQLFCNHYIMEFFPFKDVNMYDIRRPCTYPPLCYNFDNVAAYLNRPDVREALHVRPEVREWQLCNDVVKLSFTNDVMKNYHELLVPLLQSGVKVLNYAGDSDFMCNWMGNEGWSLALEWSGQEVFNATEPRVYHTSDGRAAGEVRSHGGFTFLRVFESGHMVPMDQPAMALEMLNAFTGSDPVAAQSWNAAIGGQASAHRALRGQTKEQQQKQQQDERLEQEIEAFSSP